jgi:1-acyl-sn-glycerol-3-phosphate acyltransferase
MAEKETYQYLLQNRKMRVAFYRFMKERIVRPLVNRWLDVRVEGLENIPEGPCIIVTHHCLYLDSCVIGTVLKRKAHGWIDEDVFLKPGLRFLCNVLEQIPVVTGSRASREDYRKTKEMSCMWLKNTNEHVVLTNDGASRFILDENGQIRDLASRINHSGAASLAMDTGVPVVAVASWVCQEHQKELFVSRGLKSIKYMEKNRKIPYLIHFSESINPSRYQSKKELKENIRKQQIDSCKKLSIKNHQQQKDDHGPC